MELSSSTDSIIEKLSRLAREYRVQIFYAFGSRAAMDEMSMRPTYIYSMCFEEPVIWRRSSAIASNPC
jgi:hypothetical protein